VDDINNPSDAAHYVVAQLATSTALIFTPTGKTRQRGGNDAAF